MLSKEIKLYDNNRLLFAAYELAARFNLPRAYDAQYLALVERLNCDFWTADERLANSIAPRFPHIHWLGDFTPPSN